MDLNIWAILVAALSSFVLGGVWYSPLLFLKPWNRAVGRSDDYEQKHPARVFGLSFVFALVAAYVFALFLGPQPDLMAAIHKALLVGVGFVVMCFGINYQFADRPVSALLIDGGYHTAQFLVYGLILGLWH